MRGTPANLGPGYKLILAVMMAAAAAASFGVAHAQFTNNKIVAANRFTTTTFNH